MKALDSEDISKLRPDRRRRYLAELKVRILAWLDRATAAGWLEAQCAALLGIRTTRLMEWRDSRVSTKQRDRAEVPDRGEALAGC